eukprot:s1843_g9.t1
MWQIGVVSPPGQEDKMLAEITGGIDWLTLARKSVERGTSAAVLNDFFQVQTLDRGVVKTSYQERVVPRLRQEELDTAAVAFLLDNATAEEASLMQACDSYAFAFECLLGDLALRLPYRLHQIVPLASGVSGSTTQSAGWGLAAAGLALGAHVGLAAAWRFRATAARAEGGGKAYKETPADERLFEQVYLQYTSEYMKGPMYWHPDKMQGFAPDYPGRPIVKNGKYTSNVIGNLKAGGVQDCDHGHEWCSGCRNMFRLRPNPILRRWINRRSSLAHLSEAQEGQTKTIWLSVIHNWPFA